VDELIKLVAQKAGIPAAAAKTAVETVVGFLKKKLPAPLAGQIDVLLANPDLAGQAESLVGGLGAALGQAKPKKG
jgi:hypothetical protein